MKNQAIKTVAFDARYINDRYHGIGRYAYNLLDALAKLDPDRRYLAFYHPDYPNTRFNIETLREHDNVELRPIRLPLYTPREQFIWPSLLSRSQADLFHSPYVALPLLARIKSVLTIHDLIFERYQEYRPRGILKHFYGPVTQLGVNRADLILTVSEATKHEIETYYPIKQARIHITGNGVDVIFKREDNVARLIAVRERYHLPEHFILTLGAGRPHKNVAILVEAFARLDPSLAPTLVIGGELDQRFPDSVGARIHVHNIANRVIRLGTIQEADLPALYSLADVFVFPSLVEGFGLPLLEAMACGIPVIASTTPAVSEVVGNAALTFDAHDPEQLALALNKILTNTILQTALIQHGRERIRTFTWENVAQNTLKAYASIDATVGEMSHAAIH